MNRTLQETRQNTGRPPRLPGALALVVATLSLLLWPAFPACGRITAKGGPTSPSPGASPSPAPALPPIYVPNMQPVVVPPPVRLPGPTEPSGDIPNRPLTAEEAARIALLHQPSVVVARAAVAAARGRTMQVQAGLLPGLSLSGNYTNTDVTSNLRTNVISASQIGTTSGATATATANQSGAAASSAAAAGGTAALTTPGYQVAASLRQLLFDFNHTRDAVRQLLELERVALANLTRVQADLVLQVKQSFFTLLQNERLVTVNETNVRNQQEHLALAEARFRAGLGLPADVVRAQTAVAEAVFNLTQARNNASLARVTLSVQLGLDPRTPIVPAESSEPPVTTQDPQDLFVVALQRRPEVAQAEALVRSSQWGVRAAHSTDAPALSGTLGFTGRGTTFPPTDTETFTAGLVLQWSFFDGGLTAGRVREARANVESAQAQLQSTRLTVLSDVSQAWLNLRTAEQGLVTSASGVANAEESLRLATGRYRAGLGTFIDVLDAESALLTAQTNQVNARTSVDTAHAALVRAMGLGLNAIFPTPPAARPPEERPLPRPGRPAPVPRGPVPGFTRPESGHGAPIPRRVEPSPVPAAPLPLPGAPAPRSKAPVPLSPSSVRQPLP